VPWLQPERKALASRPLHKCKGRDATSLGAVLPDKQKQKQKRVGVLFLLCYVLFGGAHWPD